MGNFEIIQRNGNKINLQSMEPFCAVKSATQNTSLMGDDNVQISFVSSELYTFGKGDKIIVGSEEYTIRTKVQREIVSDGYYQYDATFYGVMYELMKSLYRNTGEDGKSTTSTFDLTYSIRDFVKVLIYNVSRDYPGLWMFDEENCPDTEPRTISFSKQNCLQVLQSLCSENEFGLEFHITQDKGVRTIHIGKFGSKVNPPSGSEYFEWGKGNGLYNLKEQKVDDKTIITRLWVEGGSTNIKSGYRNYSERLQLPYPRRTNKNDHKLADGTVVEAGSEYIGIDDDSKRYLEDAELRDALGSDEDAVTFDDIYPKRTGEVTAIGSDINSFTDATMDFDLCKKDNNGTIYLIDGVAAKITFITGKLAGQQFELAEKGGYNHTTKTFKLIPFTDNRGLTIPTTDTEAFRIAVGDRYKLTDINMPDSYLDDAEEELWYAGMDEFTPRTQARAQYELTFDRSYFLSNLPSDSDDTIFHVGDYLPVKDERFGIEKTIRIQKITRNLLTEHDYSLTLSDIVAVSIISQTVVDVKEHERVIESNRLRDLNKARKGWRTTEELRNMVYDTDGYFDSENIRPNSIDTNMLTVGSKSQQFVLTDVLLEANVNGFPNRFNASAGVLSHLTIDETEIKQWNMSAAEFTLSSSGGYYLFAKCSKAGNTGVWYLTQEQLKVESTEDPNNYYFQVGIVGSLNSDDNFRDFITTYGFTRINGNTITSGKIVTSDGECYLDLDGNKFRIGDDSSSVDWNVTANNQLTLHNVRLLSGSGDTAPIGVYRGTYNSTYTYYYGDEVSYTYNGETCTYRYTSKTSTSGIAPTNGTYWSVVAKGAQGSSGESPIIADISNEMQSVACDSSGELSAAVELDSITCQVLKGTTSQTVTSIKLGTITLSTSYKTIITGVQAKWSGSGTAPTVTVKVLSGVTLNQVYRLTVTLNGTYEVGYTLNCVRAGSAGEAAVLYEVDCNYNVLKYGKDGSYTPSTTTGLVFRVRKQVGSSSPTYLTASQISEAGILMRYTLNGGTTYNTPTIATNGTFTFAGYQQITKNIKVTIFGNNSVSEANVLDSETVPLVADGDVGVPGTDGGYYEFRYAVNGSTSTPPTLSTTSRTPSGWYTYQPSVGTLEYLWRTMAKISGEDDSLLQNWSAPVRVNPYDGKDGISVINVDVEYAKGESNVTAPTTGWQTDAPAWEDGKYIWSRTKTTYSEGNSTVTQPACITGGKGATGVSGVGVRSIVEQYYLSSSATSLLDGEWSTTRPSWKDGWYIWTRSVISYTNGTSTTTDAICVTGSRGATGTGVSNVTEYYLTSNSSSGITTSTIGWSTTVKIPTESSKYLWNYEKVTYSNGDIVNTTPHIIGMYSADGKGIANITEYYARSTSNTTPPSYWTTEIESLTSTYKYLWNYTMVTYSDNSVKSTTPIVIGVYGDKGDKGDKGEKGDSPALVFRGTYDSSATYYGNANRVDCVKYNGVYYVARIDAGTFSGYIPTNTTYWNTFGAQFESVATQLLLAENANIAGWVFRNNRLESQNGSVYLDGVNGKVRLNGTLQLSTAYKGNISDSNIFYLPAITSEQELTMGHELDDIGKICHLFNSSPFGGADYLIRLDIFGIAADGLSVDATFGTVIARLKPQEHIELTCYELKPKSLYSSSFQMYMDTCAKWDMTNRFGYDNYRNMYARGRYPLIMAIMRITGSGSGVSVSGEFWNGESIPLIFNASRIDTGHYKVSFDSDVLPSGYKIIASGFGTSLNEGTPIKATIMAIESTYFEIYTSDDASRNDGSCDLVIFSPNWSYDQ